MACLLGSILFRYQSKLAKEQRQADGTEAFRVV